MGFEKPSVRSCPKVHHTTAPACPRNLDPVYCGPDGACEYQNKCLAEAVGFAATECAPRRPFKSSLCRIDAKKPSKKAMEKCSEKIQQNSRTNKEVVCGSNKCRYDNRCLARRVGKYSKVGKKCVDVEPL